MCAPAAPLGPSGPRHASTTRGRCCSKLAGVPRPSAAGSPRWVGWQGNGRLLGPCCSFEAVSGPESKARTTGASRRRSWGGAGECSVQGTGRTPPSFLPLSRIPFASPKSLEVIPQQAYKNSAPGRGRKAAWAGKLSPPLSMAHKVLQPPPRSCFVQAQSSLFSTINPMILT